MLRQGRLNCKATTKPQAALLPPTTNGAMEPDPRVNADETYARGRYRTTMDLRHRSINLTNQGRIDNTTSWWFTIRGETWLTQSSARKFKGLRKRRIQNPIKDFAEIRRHR
jgi:hypothetical protein